MRPRTEKASGLRCGVDLLGYSPERINPGDREHPLEKIVKIRPGPESLDHIAGVTSRSSTRRAHRASSIKVAEAAAKVLENTQRDINIALMNEMSKICDPIGIRTADAERGRHQVELPEVHARPSGRPPHRRRSLLPDLQGAGTGHHPEVILSGRRINDGMASHGADAGPQRPPERVDPVSWA